MRRVRLTIHGIVQGVFFRAHTQQVARSLALSGYVRNLPDGSVEAVATGPKEKLDAFVAWCHKGPPSATVERVTISWEDASEHQPGFHIAY